MGDLFPASEPVKASPRGHRLPTDWQPSMEARQFAISLGLDPDPIADNFRDYWTSKAGAGARKIDWLAAWRLWVRREAERPQAKKASVRAPQPQQEAPVSEWRRRLKDYRPGKFWSAMWGPKPEHGNPLISASDLAWWKAGCP